MATEGIEGICVETHNWGRTAKFFRELGFDVEFETDHGSGMLRCGDGPYVFVESCRPTKRCSYRSWCGSATPEICRPGPPAEVVKPFEETHWGTQEKHVRDPDGRIWSLQAPPKVQQ